LTIFITPERTGQAQVSLQFTATPAFEGNYVPGTWLPLRISLINNGSSLNALLVATLPNNPNRYTLPVDLATGAQKIVTLYVAMETETRKIQVSIENNGVSVARQDVEVRPRPDERLFGITSRQPLVISLPRRQDLEQLPFTLVDLPPSLIPAHSEGLDSLTLLMISDITSEMLTQEQQQTLVEWTVAGGHLIIGGGLTAENTLTALPKPLRIVTLDGTVDLNTDSLSELVEAPGPDVLPGVKLKPLPGTRYTGSPEAPLWVQRELGDGMITQLAFNPGFDILNTWAAAPIFWDHLLQPATMIPGPFGFETNADHISEQTLTAALSNLPAIQLPRSRILFAALVFYVILIGPGIALVLRRMDQEVLGWIVLPVVALTATALSLGGAYALRANQQIISQISLIEQHNIERTRIRTFVGMLSPQDTTFNVQVADDVLVRPLYATSGLYGSVDGVTSDFVQQSDMFQVMITRWNLQGFMAESRSDFSALDAQILLSNNGIQIQIHNTTEQTIRDAVVVHGEKLIRIGNLSPRQKQTIDWLPVDISNEDQVRLGTPLSYLVLKEPLDAARKPGGVPDRRVLIREALLNAAVMKSTSKTDEGPFVFAWLEQNPLPVHIAAPNAATQQMNLLVVRPTISGRGAVSLPTGWLRPDPDIAGYANCFGREGAGISIQPVPVTVTLQLPNDLAALQTSALTLTLTSERDWPNVGVTTELFNWQQQRWVEFDFDGPGNLRVPEPAPFMQNGQVRLRLDGRIGEAACLFARAQLTGVLP